MPSIVCIGDSVHWGQGLEPGEKFANQLSSDLGYGPSSDMRAHSGAIIGIGDDFEGSSNPEVPFHYPTVRQQVAFYEGHTSDVGVVLNGDNM